MAKKKREPWPCVSYVRMADGSAKLLDDFTPEEKQEWLDGVSKKLSEVMTRYYEQHPEEYIAFCKSCEEDNKQEEGGDDEKRTDEGV